MLAARTVVDGERAERQGGPDMEESAGEGWSVAPVGGGVPFSLVARLATREEIDTTLRDQRPPEQRPDMPLCHASDLRVPKTYAEAQRCDHSTQFMDAAKREIHGLLEAKTFEVVQE